MHIYVVQSYFFNGYNMQLSDNTSNKKNHRILCVVLIIPSYRPYKSCVFENLSENLHIDICG